PAPSRNDRGHRSHRASPLAHVLRALHRGARVLLGPGEGDSRADSHTRPPRASDPGRARNHVVLGVARPDPAEPTRHRRRSILAESVTTDALPESPGPG